MLRKARTMFTRLIFILYSWGDTFFRMDSWRRFWRSLGTNNAELPSPRRSSEQNMVIPKLEVKQEPPKLFTSGQQLSYPPSFNTLQQSSSTAKKDDSVVKATPLEERREQYRCGKHFSMLSDIKTWPEYVEDNAYYFKKIGYKYPDEDIAEVNNDLNTKVSLWQGDITTLEIDAIVNAANKSLLGGGGVDGCIHRAAGSGLLKECRTLGGCDTGKAKITSGYKLPAKHVIHTVGPIGENKEKLQSCYESCLQLVKEHHLKSVAFCSISTGIYGYPAKKAANVALTTVKNWLLENSETVDRVIFCVFLSEDLDIYTKFMLQHFPYVPKMARGGNKKGGKPATPDDENTRTVTSTTESSELPRSTSVTSGMQDVCIEESPKSNEGTSENKRVRDKKPDEGENLEIESQSSELRDSPKTDVIDDVVDIPAGENSGDVSKPAVDNTEQSVGGVSPSVATNIEPATSPGISREGESLEGEITSESSAQSAAADKEGPDDEDVTAARGDHVTDVGEPGGVVDMETKKRKHSEEEKD